MTLATGRKLKVRRLQPPNELSKSCAGNLLWKDQDPAFAELKACGYDIDISGGGSAVMIAASMMRGDYGLAGERSM